MTTDVIGKRQLDCFIIWSKIMQIEEVQQFLELLKLDFWELQYLNYAQSRIEIWALKWIK